MSDCSGQSQHVRLEAGGEEGSAPAPFPGICHTEPYGEKRGALEGDESCERLTNHPLFRALLSGAMLNALLNLCQLCLGLWPGSEKIEGC